MRRRLPSPLDPTAWSDPLRAVAWAALGSVALVAIGAGLGAVSSLLGAQGGAVYALLAGWLLGLLAESPIGALVARGWRRGQAVALVWIAGALPVVLILAKLVTSLVASLGTLLADAPPSAEAIGRAVARPTELLGSFGLRVDLVPLAGDLLALLRDWAAVLEANLASVAAGALSALGPVVLALGTGLILSLYEPDLSLFGPRATGKTAARLRRSQLLVERILARFIGRHLALGLTFGTIAYLGAALAGADGLLAGLLGGLVMAVPALGQGVAFLPPLALALASSGPGALVGIALILAGWLLCALWLAPRLLAGVLRLSGAAVFFAGTAGGVVGGPLGAIFAVPLLAALLASRRE
jgi:predicted PurR-regulated permease PerM